MIDRPRRRDCVLVELHGKLWTFRELADTHRLTPVVVSERYRRGHRGAALVTPLAPKGIRPSPRYQGLL